MPRPFTGKPRHPTRWLAGAAGTAGLASLAGRALERRWRQAQDPVGPAELVVPIGRETVVRTDDGAELVTTIAGADVAAPRRHTVVLSHCWTGSRAVWAPVAHRLADAGHRVVLYDQRGHGASSLGAEPMTVERLGDDLASVLDQLDVSDAVLAGHSMGGFSIMAYAVEHPDDAHDRVRGLALVATAARGVSAGPLNGAATNVVGGRVAGWATARPRLGLLFVREAVGRRPRHGHLDITRQLFRATPPRVRIDALRALGRADLRAGLVKVETPTVVLTGRWDMLTPPWLGREIARTIPGARFELLPDAGHMLPLEAPERVAAVIGELTLAA